MLNLMKYDLRRRRERLLACFVIMVLVQIGIWISNSSMGVALVSLNMITYAVFGGVLLFSAIISYDRFLRSYARRLLPVPTIQSVLSPLLLCWALLLAVLVIAGIHLGVYILLYSPGFLPDNFVKVASWSILHLFWSAGFELILLMFAITAARSLRMKGTIWIGIAVFMIIENGLSYIERLFWGSYLTALENVFRFEVYEASAAPSGLEISYTGTDLGPLLFEAVVGVILIYVITVLIQKRIEN